MTVIFFQFQSDTVAICQFCAGLVLHVHLCSTSVLASKLGVALSIGNHFYVATGQLSPSEVSGEVSSKEFWGAEGTGLQLCAARAPKSQHDPGNEHRVSQHFFFNRRYCTRYSSSSRLLSLSHSLFAFQKMCSILSSHASSLEAIHLTHVEEALHKKRNVFLRQKAVCFTAWQPFHMTVFCRGASAASSQWE